MKFFLSLLLTGFFAGSLFLPLVHLVEISHAGEAGMVSAEISETDGTHPENLSSDTSGCEEYILSFHSERLPTFSKDLGKIPAFFERKSFSEDSLYKSTDVSFSFGSTDPPPVRTSYSSLVGIMKNQV